MNLRILPNSFKRFAFWHKKLALKCTIHIATYLYSMILYFVKNNRFKDAKLMAFCFLYNISNFVMYL